MNELLQKHGCANVFNVPEGLKELMADITREVLRDQPAKIFDYIANYLSVLLLTREHGVLAVKVLDDLCDCKPTVSEHLMQLGLQETQAQTVSQVIQEEIEGLTMEEEKEKVKETQILKKILTRTVLDEETSAKVCQIARNAYRDYWYRKKLLEKQMKVHPEEPWEIAAERTLQLYKTTRPSLAELHRATEKIQAAYRGYYVRRNLLQHLRPKKRQGPKLALPGPPLDIAHSREIDLGPVLDITVREDNVEAMFQEAAVEELGLPYDPMKTITHVEDIDEELDEIDDLTEIQSKSSKFQSQALSAKSLASRSMMGKSVTGKSLIDKNATSESVASSRIIAVTSRVDQDMPVVGEEEVPVEQFRKSHVGSVMSAPSRRSRVEGSLQKITFTEESPALIEDAEEIAEDITVNEATEGEEATVVTEATDVDETQDVEDDGVTAPDVSVPSSAPDTDVEEAADSAPDEVEDFAEDLESSAPETAVTDEDEV